jgi:glucokinase
MARFAGDLALAFNSTGGVTLAGGILPKIIKFVDEFDFRRCFENKAPFQEFMKEIPTRVITLPDSVLNGMVEIAANPHLFAIDYEHRVWRAFESRQMSSNA